MGDGVWEARSMIASNTSDFIRRNGLIVAFGAILAVVALSAPTFLTFGNLLGVLRQIAIVGTIAVGATFVVISGRLDLSVGSGLTLLSVLVVSQNNHLGPAGAVAVTLGCGLLIGACNGFLVAYLRFDSLIATLAMLSLLQGVTLWYSGGANVNVADSATWFSFFGRGSVFGIPAPVVLLILGAAVASFVLMRTRFGRAVFAVGGNETASIFSGIAASRIVFMTYLISGLATACAAVIMGSRVMGAQSTIGQGYELTVLAGIILGGTSLLGGYGSIWRTLVGVAMLGFIENGLILMGFPYYVQWLVTWAIVIAAVWIDLAAKRGRFLA